MAKIKRQRKQNKSKGKGLLSVLFLFIALGLTVAFLMQPQKIMQFAQETYNAPPLFGCLQVGEGTDQNCGTKSGESDDFNLWVNGNPYVGQIIYRGDTMSGAYKYTNTGDLPISLKYVGIAAGSTETGRIAEFNPVLESKTIKSKGNLQVGKASYKFKTTDPKGGWIVGAGLTNTEGQPLPVAEGVNFRVSGQCTALRVKELTAKDKSNIKSLCSSNPDNKLCKSRQYCELFTNGPCNQPAAGKEGDVAQCDEYIVLEKAEQDILEELCKASPDTDACKDFCKRSMDSKICPPIIYWFDNKSGKQVFPVKAKYMASVPSDKAVAGAKAVPDNYLAAVMGPAMPRSPIITRPPPTVPAGGATPAKVVPLIKVGAKVAPSLNPGFDPQTGKALPGTPGFKPSCASHRANEEGTCCASGYPLINGCCQPGCFVWKSAPKGPGNCTFRNKSGQCCSEEAVAALGYCQASQAPAGSGIVPIAIPRDPKIYPPQMIELQKRLLDSGAVTQPLQPGRGPQLAPIPGGVGGSAQRGINRTICEADYMGYDAARNVCVPPAVPAPPPATGGVPAQGGAGIEPQKSPEDYCSDGGLGAYNPSTRQCSGGATPPGTSNRPGIGQTCNSNGSPGCASGTCTRGGNGTWTCQNSNGAAVVPINTSSRCTSRTPDTGVCIGCATGYTLNPTNNQCETTQ